MPLLPARTRPFLGLLATLALTLPALSLPAQTPTPPPAVTTPPPAPAPYPIKEHYTKFSLYIPMRDGKRLFTVVYVPNDASPTQKYPIMLQRTCYSVGPYATDTYKSALGPSRKFAEAGYIFAYQDVRGRFLSEGEFINMRPEDAAKKGRGAVDESTDTYDTIDWLVKSLPNNNGRVGMWGISYPGFYTAAGTIHSHPALKAASPQAPISDWFAGDDVHHNGAFYLLDTFSFFSFFGAPRPQPTTTSKMLVNYSSPDAYKFFLELGPLKNAETAYLKGNIPFWQELMAHGTYDAWWKERDLLPNLRGVKCAVMTTGGWYDAEDFYGPLHIYHEIERANPGITNRIVIGPWTHGGWAGGEFARFGDFDFGSRTGLYYREQLELPFFDYYLKDKGTPQRAEATVFETGGNRWLTFPTWPPQDAHNVAMYLSEFHKLSASAPHLGPEANTTPFDQWVSDPANPVPYIQQVQFRRRNEYLIDDQRFAAARPDVVSYQSDPLPDDMTVAGPIPIELYVSTTGTDSDWVVKVIDVQPDDAPDPTPNPTNLKMGGYQRLVRADILRGKFRSSFSNPAPFTPGKPTPLKFTLNDVCHTFAKGHRVMVQIQSSWFPLVDRNPQTFGDIYTAEASAFQKATQRVYRSAPYASRITLPQITVAPSSVIAIPSEYKNQ